ncbi:C39 family peptidase [Nonomuraea sp. NPDC050328]|uniref:C39 family peptidase n=1 Tax=Nonomuraea sp. NPDC050328 TaxID=3364361 RepID=UPI00378A72FA
MKTFLARTALGTVVVSTLVALQPGSAQAAPASTPLQSSSAIAQATVPAGAQSPIRAKLAIKEVYQTTDYWCAPASAEISLRTLGVKVPQATLAKKMRTTKENGTSAEDQLRVLNAYAKNTGYAYAPAWDVYNAKRLGERLAYSIGVLRKATPIQLYIDRLPWYKGVDFGAPDVVHMIVAYGYDKKAKTVLVWDPNTFAGGGGRYTITMAQLAKATESNKRNESGHRYWGMYQPVKN